MDASDIIWIAILVISVLGGSLKKIAGKLQPTAPAAGVPKMEGLDHELEEDDYTEFDQDWKETSSQPKNEEYFTYESADSNTWQAMSREAEKEEERLDAAKAATMQPEAAVDFDLKKAVIYQTILNNDYIADLK